MLCSLSSIDQGKVEQIRSLEQEVGVRLLAFNCHDPKLAKLKDLQLEKVSALERKLGVVLVAVQ